MKPSVLPRTVAVLILGTLSPLCAQNLSVGHDASQIRPLADDLAGNEKARFRATDIPVDRYQVPGTYKAEASISEGSPVFATQDSLTLDHNRGKTRDIESVVDLSVIRETSPYRRMLVSQESTPEGLAGNLQQGLAEVSAAYRPEGQPIGDQVDCVAVTLSVEQRIKMDLSKVLEVVESEVAANPSCACEIVKAAIKASEADANLVASIVEVSITAAPDKMRLISQCAIASSPESLANVQAVMARLDPNRGETGYSSKGAKSAKSAKEIAPVAAKWPDPLDLPPPFLPPPPPPFYPPPVTDVDGPKVP
jgi:hypothetical protein